MGSLTSIRVAFETARLRLAEIHDQGKDARVAAYRIACKHSASTLQVERVSIWLLAEDGESLVCMLQYEAASDQYSSGQKLLRRDCPQYFDAVRSRRVIVADDAVVNAQTRELRAYLEASKVGALLDAPIYRDGQVIGVVCHEHVGGPRNWSEKEAGFASAVADMLTILTQQAERAELRAAIDAQRQLEAQNQKMHALVKLGRVVAHDLSNILMVASLRAEMLKTETDLDAASDEITQVLGYGNELLRQLRDFCNEREPAPNVEVVELLRTLSPVLNTLMGKGIVFRLACDMEAVHLAIPKVEFEQLILNLCMNAKDAVSDTGEISVNVSKSPDQLTIQVTDDGVGMDEATQARLFEPFYTTKQGHSGIGLSAVYGIVERARGRVDVESAPGKGTTFRILLPLTTTSDAMDMPWGF